MDDRTEEMRAGDQLSASQFNLHAELASRIHVAPDQFVDVNGSAQRPTSSGSVRWRWAKLDAELEPDSNVTASIWTGYPLADSGIDQEVYAPPLLIDGAIPQYSWVKLEKYSNGKWYVTMWQPVQVIPLTNYRFDAASLNFQVKTQECYVMVKMDESDWVTKHTGEECPEGS